jgi:hypothetical protein
VPSKKQRRRREKERRHDYEYVYVDSEGREVEVAERESDGDRAATAAPKKAASSARPAKGRSASSSRPVRKVDPPSWRRVLRRGAIFAPFMFLFIYYAILKSSNRSLGTALYQTAFLMAFFIPFSYLMDRMMYRTYLRKTGQAPPSTKPRRR